MRWLDGITDSINGHEFEQALEDVEGQGGLACCSPWGHKEWDTTERLNLTEYYIHQWALLPCRVESQLCHVTLRTLCSALFFQSCVFQSFLQGKLNDLVGAKL